MKTMTCKQLGGGCEKVFQANTFDELVAMSKLHAMEMFQKQDPEHLDAMKHALQLMQDPTALQAWMDEKKAEFEALADD